MSIIEPLPNKVITEKENILKGVLNHLSKDLIKESEFDECARRLSFVYDGEYRQLYSSLYPMIEEISDNDPTNLDALLYNLENLRIHVKEDFEGEGNFERYLYGRLIKLNDHLNLEYQRYVDTQKLKRDIDDMSELSKNLENGIKNMSELSEGLENKLREVGNKTSRMQTEMVLVLSIFAVIVMAFSGSLTILGGSLTGMVSVNPLKLAFVIILCGIIIFNTVAFLIHRIGKIVTGYYSEKSGDDEYMPESRRIWSSLRLHASNNRYVVIFNALLLILLAVNIYLWHIH